MSQQYYTRATDKNTIDVLANEWPVLPDAMLDGAFGDAVASTYWKATGGREQHAKIKQTILDVRIIGPWSAYETSALEGELNAAWHQWVYEKRKVALAKYRSDREEAVNDRPMSAGVAAIAGFAYQALPFFTELPRWGSIPVAALTLTIIGGAKVIARYMNRRDAERDVRMYHVLARSAMIVKKEKPESLNAAQSPDVLRTALQWLTAYLAFPLRR